MAIEFRAVSKRVSGEVHIHPTDLVLEPEGFNILLGTTLSGKTTLLRLMAGLERPSDGTVLFHGVDVTGVAVQRRNVSMVYQQFINYPNLSVFENIASPLRIGRMSKDEVVRRVGEIAELLRLTPMLTRRPSELSGGQQQRTALARALVKDADLVLLDEPLANLDYKLREELRDELPRLLARKGATVVYATSEPQEALLLGGHTATLHEGRVTQFGPTAEIYRRPRDLLSATVFADPPLNMATAMKRGSDFELDGCDLRWSATGAAIDLGDGEYRVGLRPYHLTPSPVGESAISIDAQVLVAELSGSESLVHTRVGGHNWVSQSHGVHAVEVGATERLYIQAERFLYFDAHGALVAS
jgi:glycerol transport system ATP-binding protein